jgi:outer membrane protein OmpA-like peptidoglycan-associated protein/opacity protein-like surface antigen
LIFVHPQKYIFMRTYVNLKLLLLAVLILAGFKGFSQEPTAAKVTTGSEAERWSLSFLVGPTQFYGDISSDVFWPGGSKNGEIGLSFQGFATRQFTPVFGANAKIMYSDIVAEEALAKMYFNADVIHYGINGTVSFSNWFFPNRAKKRFDTYMHAGLGRNHYRTIAKSSDTDTILRYFGYTNGGLDKIDRIAESSYTLGLGVKYRLSQRLDILLEMAQVNMPTDRLDGIVTVLSELDKYGYTSIGVTYKFGKVGNNLLWDSKSEIEENPAFINTNDKLDSLANVVNNMNTSLTILMQEREMEKGPDLDEDGVPDYRDMELNTPKGNMVNFLGVSIPNCCDPSKPNYKAAQGEAASSGSVIASGNLISSVFFQLNSTFVTPINKERIAIAALALKKNSNLKLEIIGSTCSLASDEYNIDLSMRRANMVKNILVKEYGIAEARLIVKYDGETKAHNQTSENKHLNRRVDLLFAK